MGPHLLRRGHGCPRRNTPRTTCYLVKFGHSRSNGTSVITQIRRKNWTPASHLLRSLKVTRYRSIEMDHRLPMTYHGSISYRFRDKRWFRSKIAKFSHPVYLTLLLKRFPLEFYIGCGARKNWIDAPIRPTKSVTICPCV